MHLTQFSRNMLPVSASQIRSRSPARKHIVWAERPALDAAGRADPMQTLTGDTRQPAGDCCTLALSLTANLPSICVLAYRRNLLGRGHAFQVAGIRNAHSLGPLANTSPVSS